MQISDQRLDEFVALYRAEFDVELSEKDALEAGIVIVKLVQAVYGDPSDV